MHEFLWTQRCLGQRSVNIGVDSVNADLCAFSYVPRTALSQIFLVDIMNFPWHKRLFLLKGTVSRDFRPQLFAQNDRLQWFRKILYFINEHITLVSKTIKLLTDDTGLWQNWCSKVFQPFKQRMTWQRTKSVIFIYIFSPYLGSCIVCVQHL